MPTRFKLWGVTRRLLEAEKGKDERLVLLGKEGKPPRRYVIRSACHMADASQSLQNHPTEPQGSLIDRGIHIRIHS